MSAVQAVRRASQAVVDELGKAVTLDVFDVVAEAYNTGHRAAVAELGALSDTGGRLVDDITADEISRAFTTGHRQFLAPSTRFRPIPPERLDSHRSRLYAVACPEPGRRRRREWPDLISDRYALACSSAPSPHQAAG